MLADFLVWRTGEDILLQPSINKPFDNSVWNDMAEKLFGAPKASGPKGDETVPQADGSPTGPRLDFLIPGLPALKVGGLSLEVLVQAVARGRAPNRHQSGYGEHQGQGPGA